MNPGELRAFLQMADEAMTAEEIPGDVRKRVINRVVFLDPEGYRPWIDPKAQAHPFVSAPAFPGPRLPFETAPFHALTEDEIAPAESAPWFGRDGREILAETDSVPAVSHTISRDDYPLTSTCKCGRMITRTGSTAQWEHTD